MISLIICSRKLNISQELEGNIVQTIGVEYELILLDNSQNKYSIFSAYNEGVKRAKYPYLCFMHDDIIYHTLDWGRKVIEHFKKDSLLGVLGTVGGHYFPKLPTAWFHCHVVSGGGYNGCFVNGKHVLQEERYLEHFDGKDSIEAVIVDGLWFCIPQKMFEKISFDENTFDGFHCYDSDICLQIRNINYNVKIAADIIIEHRYAGGCNQSWIDETKKFYEKWKDKLPQEAGVKLSDTEKKLIDLFVQDIFCLTENYNQIKEKLNSEAYFAGKHLPKFILIQFKYVYKLYSYLRKKMRK